MEQCGFAILGTLMGNICDSINTIYSTQVIILLTYTLFSVFRAKIHS